MKRKPAKEARKEENWYMMKKKQGIPWNVFSQNYFFRVW
jgi:hypothetical protein